MPVRNPVFSFDSSEKATRSATGPRRRALLIGASLLASAAFPATAWAQNECGAAPPGPDSTVTCTPAGNPYGSGITYTGVVEDLTVVLDPGTNVTDTVTMTSTLNGVDLRLIGPAGTNITTAGAGNDGAIVDTNDGSVYISLDVVSTNGDSATGIGGYANNGVSILANSVSTGADFSDGIHARVEGSFTGDEGAPLLFVNVGNVSTSGEYSEGIYTFTSFGPTTVIAGTVQTSADNSDGIVINSGGEANLTAGSVSTQGNNSDAVDVFSANGGVNIEVGSVSTQGDNSYGIDAGALKYGGVTVNAGTVFTAGEGSAGIFATAPNGSVNITAGSVSTAGNSSDGITGLASKYADISASVSVTATSVSTSGNDSTGIYAAAGGSVSVNAGSVSTTGDNSAGIVARQFTEEREEEQGDQGAGNAIAGPAVDNVIGVGPGVYVSSGTMTTTGDNSPGVIGYSANGFVSITSGTVNTSGEDSIGIGGYAETDLSITSGSIITTGLDSDGIIAVADNGYAIIDSGTISTAGDYADGITVTAFGDVDITSGSITTGGLRSDGIDAISIDGNLTVASTLIATTGDYADGITVFAPDGDVTVTSGSVSTTGFNAYGIDAASKYGDVSVISTGTVSTQGEDSVGIRADSKYGDVSVASNIVTTAGDFSPGILGDSKYGSVSVISSNVSTTGDNSVGISAIGATSVSVNSTSVTTTGDNSAGIFAQQVERELPLPGAPSGAAAVIGVGPGVTVISGTMNTMGNNSPGVVGVSNNGWVDIVSGAVTTTGNNSGGVVADAYSDARIVSGTVATSGTNSTGIVAGAYYGYIDITSTGITTTGANSGGILAITGGPTNGGADIYIESGSVVTSGVNSSGIIAIAGIGTNSAGGNVEIQSASVSTTGANALGIGVLAYGNVTIGSGTVSTTGVSSLGIYAASYYGDIAVTSNSVTTTGAGAAGIVTLAYDGDTIISSGTISTTGIDADGIYAQGAGNVTVTSTSVITAGEGATGIDVTAIGGNASVTSGQVRTSGDYTYGIDVYTFNGDVVVNSTSVTTTGYVAGGISTTSIFGDTSITSGTISTTGDYSDGMNAFAYVGNIVVVSTGQVNTAGYASDGIDTFAYYGDITITSSGAIRTIGDQSTAIEAQAYGDGDITITSSAALQTSGTNSHGIYAFAEDGTVQVTNTAGIGTIGTGGTGISAIASERVVINSNAIATTAAGSIGIFARQTDTTPTVGGISVTSTNVTTSGTGAHGIDARAYAGAVSVISNGTITTSGADARGIIALSVNGTVAVDANNITATGATTDAIIVQSSAGSTVTIRGLVQSTNGFEVFAAGLGAATVNTTASGIIRGQVSLTAQADTVNNAGRFDAIGTSQFGAGTDVFNNSGLTTSFSGAAVFAGLETFNNLAAGRIDMRDGAVGDTLNVSGAYVGTAGGRLLLDANNQTRLADVLIVGGAATGSTALDVTLLAPPVFDLVGTLVVDAAAGTSANAFTLGTVSITNPLVRLGLIFDTPNNNFLLVGLPDQPVFESVAAGEAAINFWYQSADAITYQLEAARDGTTVPGTTNLTGNGRWGGWIQVLAGNVERDTSQTFTGGGQTNVFDTSYDQDFQGVQAGIDYQAGGTILGISFGAGRSEVEFDASNDGLELDSINVAAYAAFNSGGFFFNAIAKIDWADAESTIGTALSTEFDATALGLRGNMGYRFQTGNVFFEPSVQLSWINVDIDDYTIGGATVVFDDITSFRGQAGLRIGGDFRSGNGTWSPFIGGYIVEEFDGDVSNTFTLGQTIAITENAPGTWGQVIAGLSYTTGSLEVFLRGEADFGGDRDGLAGRGGVRLRF